MSAVQESNTMIERAEKWIQRLDDKEYGVPKEVASTKILSVDGRTRAPFNDLSSRAMTNYQASRTHYDELREKMKTGSISRDIPFLVGQNVTRENLESLSYMEPTQENTETVDRTLLEQAKHDRTVAARDFLYYIDCAIASGILVVGEALQRKLAECEQEKKGIIGDRDSLRQQLEQVSTELISVKALYEECQKSRGVGPATGP